MSSSDLTEWTKGNAVTASHLNEVVHYLKRNGEIQVVGGTLSRGNGATIIGNGESNFSGRWFWGKVVATGVNNEVDYTSCLYFVTCEFMNPTGDETIIPSLKDDVSVYGLQSYASSPSQSTAPSYINTITAANMAEYQDNTHSLKYGSIVQVFEVFERAYLDSPTQGISRWVFYTPDVGRPQYQWQVLTGVSQNSRGWAPVKAHSL